LFAGTLLITRLADCIDLQTQTKHAHWNVKGPSFIALHELFDKFNEEVEDYVDEIARASEAATAPGDYGDLGSLSDDVFRRHVARS
jgi:DNA-binding ferritin-like protein